MKKYEKSSFISLKIRAILAPTDYSKTAQKTLEYAVSYAKQFKSKITLLHVIVPLPYPADMTYVPTGQGFPIEPSRKELTLYAKRMIPSELLGEAIVQVGVPHEVITEFARKSKTDLIIIGTHGRSDLAHVFMDSTAERVVRHASCPVLVVPRKH